MKKFLYALILLFASFFLSSCDSKFDDDYDPQLRILMATPSDRDVDIFLDDTFLVSNVRNGESTGFINTNNDFKLLTVEDSSTGEILLQSNIELDDANRYTFVIAGNENQFQGFLIEDDDDEPNLERFELRVMNLAINQGPLDVYIDRGDPSLGDTRPREISMTYGSISKYKNDRSDDYRIRVTNAGALNVLADSGLLFFRSREVATAYIVSRPNGTTRVIVLSDFPRN